MASEIKKIVPTGGSSDVPVVGNYIRIDETVTIKVVVEVTDTDVAQMKGSKFTLSGGEDYKFPGLYKRLTLSHSEVTDQAIDVLVGMGEKGSAKVSGSVNVTGGNIAVTAGTNIEIVGGTNNVVNPPFVLPGRSSTAQADFIGGAGGTALAASYVEVQLLNPAASGVNVALRSIKTSSSSNYLVQLRLYNVAILNQGIANNKYVGGPSPKATINYENRASQDGTGYTYPMSAPANDVKELLRSSPIIIPPGSGLIVCNTTVNSDMSVNFEWDEFA